MEHMCGAPHQEVVAEMNSTCFVALSIPYMPYFEYYLYSTEAE